MIGRSDQHCWLGIRFCKFRHYCQILQSNQGRWPSLPLPLPLPLPLALPLLLALPLPPEKRKGRGQREGEGYGGCWLPPPPFPLPPSLFPAPSSEIPPSPPSQVSSWLQATGNLSVLFDLGGVLGGSIAGFISDQTSASACTSCAFVQAAIPALFLYQSFGTVSLLMNIGLMMLAGLLVTGPYALITTAVSADLGTHHSLQGEVVPTAYCTLCWLTELLSFGPWLLLGTELPTMTPIDFFLNFICNALFLFLLKLQLDLQLQFMHGLLIMQEGATP